MNMFLCSYLVLVAGGLFAAFITQVFIPKVGSAGTLWGLTPGWQREIGFWCVALVVIIIGVLLRGDTAGARIVTVGAIVMGALFGTNHLCVFLLGEKSVSGLYGQNGGLLWHIYGGLANYLGVVLGVIALWASG